MNIEELHVTAGLAYLELTEAELAALAAAVTQMVDYFQTMQKIDVDGLPPTTHALLTRNRLRPDTVREGTIADSLLEHAPDREDRFVAIPNVL